MYSPKQLKYTTITPRYPRWKPCNVSAPKRTGPQDNHGVSEETPQQQSDAIYTFILGSKAGVGEVVEAHGGEKRRA